MKINSRHNIDPMVVPVMRTPRSVDLEITSRCNLRCKYCYFFDNPAVTYNDLPTGEWLQFFDELGQCGVMDVTLAGGEPFIRNDLAQLIEGIVKNRMRFSLLSNGTLINDDIARFIAETKRCNIIQISLDGSCAEVHETGRGKDSFAKAVQGFKTLQNHNISVTARVTIHKHNIHDLENTARLLLEELKLPDFSTNAAGYIGSCQKNANDLLLTVEDRQKAMETLLHLERKYEGRITAQAGPLSEAHYWRRMNYALQSGASQFDNGGHLTGCCCSSSKIAVRTDGVIVPCALLAHIELGSINYESFREVWQKSTDLNKLRKRHHIPLSSFDECSQCDYKPYCTGNCPGLAYNLTGQIDQPSPDACLQKYLADGGRLPSF